MRVQSGNPIVQSQIDYTEGSPEGRIRAPVGFLLVDREGGRIYWKGTPGEYATGWILIGGAPAGSSGMAPPVDTYQDVREMINPTIFQGAMSWGYQDPADGVFRIWRWVSSDMRPDNDADILESIWTPFGRWNQVI